MKTIFKIHPFFYLFAIICILTGYFKNFLFITCIIMFHELGHILIAYILNWKIEKVILLPFGGITIFNEYINRPIKQEFLIAIMGPIFQSFLFLINDELFKTYNLNLLLFNLLPIFPLDGSKIINLFLNKMINFKQSHLISIVISIISILFLFHYKYSLILYISILFLIIKTIKELKLHKYLYNKFLFERYLYKFKFKKTKIINNKNNMMRDYNHIIREKNKYIKEYDFLLKLFDN